MRGKITEAMVDEFEKIGFKSLITKVIKNPTVRSMGSSLGQATMWTAPSMLQQGMASRKERKATRGSVTGGVGG
jgi:hypothetical protein